MDNFDLKKYLVENKVTTNSRMLEVEMGMVPADVTGKDSYDGALPAGVKEELPKLDISAIASYVKSKFPIDAAAAKIKNDPKALDGLNKLAAMYGLKQINELDSSDIESIEMAARKFAETSTVKEEETASFRASGIFGGPLLMATVPGIAKFFEKIAYHLQGFDRSMATMFLDYKPDILTTHALMFIMSIIAGLIVGYILDKITAPFN